MLLASNNTLGALSSSNNNNIGDPAATTTTWIFQQQFGCLDHSSTSNLGAQQKLHQLIQYMIC
jgi:hypothetical protein